MTNGTLVIGDGDDESWHQLSYIGADCVVRVNFAVGMKCVRCGKYIMIDDFSASPFSDGASVQPGTQSDRKLGAYKN